MADERGIVREVSWRDLCPWLILTRIFSLATSMQMLTVALVAVAIVPLGWRGLGWLMYGNTEEQLKTPEVYRVVTLMGRLPGELLPPDADPSKDVHMPTDVPGGAMTAAPPSPIVGFFSETIKPFIGLFAIHKFSSIYFYLLFGCIWTVFVWAIPGAIITRAAALQLGREEYLDWDQAFLFSFRKFPAYVTSPLAPLLGIFLVAGLIMLAGLVMRIPAVGPLGVGAMYFLVLLLGFTASLIALGLLFGWPLMWGTLGVENSDAFDALSRSYAYTYQRPLNYLFYALVAAFLGGLGWILVSLFVQAIVYLSGWAIAMSYGADSLDKLMKDTTSPNWVAAAMFNFWNGAVLAIATAFSYSFFWCSAVAFYLLLRRDVDQMEMDEVAVDTPEDRFSLPKLKPHASGVPSVVDIKPMPATNVGEQPLPPPSSPPAG